MEQGTEIEAMNGEVVVDWSWVGLNITREG